MPHSTSYDIVIIGAGIMGLLTAHELAPSHARILILDQQQAGKESSWAGGGILSPLYPWRAHCDLQPLFLWSLKNYPDLIKTLHQNSGVNPEWLPSGLLTLNTQDANNAHSWAQKNQLSIESLNNDQLKKQHPNLNAKLDSALLLNFVAQVRNPRLLQALIATLAQKSNITLRENQPVIHIKKHASQITQIKTPDHLISANHFIFCSGAWSQKLLSPLTPSLPIEPVLGQMLVLKPKKNLIHSIILHEDHYLIPRQDGLILVGSTLEKNHFNKTTTDSAKHFLLNKAHAIIPELAQAECIHHWAGLRPYAPEGIPLIGQLPLFHNAWINAGHFRNGLTLAPASCRLLADLILQRTPIINPIPYQV